MPRGRPARPVLDVPADIHRLPSGDALRALARASDGRCVVSFSGGKDSVATVLAVRAHFREVVLVFLEELPGLRLVEESLAYYEAVWDTRIHRIPHPNFYALLREHVYQPPHRYLLIDRWGPPRYTADDVMWWIKEEHGWPQTVPVAHGLRVADSIFRRAALKKVGPWNAHRRVCYPIYDWSTAQVFEAIRHAGLLLPPDYRLFGRSFAGLDERFLAAIAQHYPDDYERIKWIFPLIETERYRYAFTRARALRASYRPGLEVEPHEPKVLP